MENDEFAHGKELVPVLKGGLWMPGIEEGIYYGLDEWEYHNGLYKNLLSSTGLKKAKRSGAHFEAWLTRKSEERKTHFEFGKAYHTYILERHNFEKKVFIAEDRQKRSNKDKAYWERIYEEHKNKAIIKEFELDVILAMAKAIRRYSEKATHIMNAPGQTEVTFIWLDPDFNIWSKCRTDKLIDIDYELNLIVDLKTTTNSDPWGFPRQAANMDYPIQAGHYVPGVSYMLDKPFTMMFLAQEKDPPYLPTVFEMEHLDVMEAAERNYEYKLTVAKGLRTGFFEGYPDKIYPLRMPKWYR